MAQLIFVWTLTALCVLLVARTIKRGEIFFGNYKDNDLKSKKEESSYWLFLFLYGLIATTLLIISVKMTLAL